MTGSFALKLKSKSPFLIDGVDLVVPLTLEELKKDFKQPVDFPGTVMACSRGVTPITEHIRLTLWPKRAGVISDEQKSLRHEHVGCMAEECGHLMLFIAGSSAPRTILTKDKTADDW